MTLDEFLADVYCPLRLINKSENTRRLYGCTLRSYAKHLGRQPTIEQDLTDLAIARFVAARAATRSPYTAEKERSQLCSLARLAADRRLIPEKPMMAPCTLPERIPHGWTIDELRRLIETAEDVDGRIGGTLACVWWPALVLTLWQTAERVGAILALGNGDYGRPKLSVRAEVRKGGKRSKTYTLTARACDLVDEVQRAGNDRLFAWDRPQSSLWSTFGHIVKRAGLGEGRKCKFHALRRSAASHYAVAGGNPTTLLDHSSPRVTRAYMVPRIVDVGPQPSEVLPDIG